MLTFKQFIAEMQASNDNPDKEVRDEFVRLHKKRSNLDSMEERKYEILKKHPAVKNHPILNKLSESKFAKALVASAMLAATPVKAGGMAHELPVYTYQEIGKKGLDQNLVNKSKEALEKAQENYDESMPGEHLSNAIDSHNNGNIGAALEHLRKHQDMINKRQSAPMS